MEVRPGNLITKIESKEYEVETHISTEVYLYANPEIENRVDLLTFNPVTLDSLRPLIVLERIAQRGKLIKNLDTVYTPFHTDFKVFSQIRINSCSDLDVQRGVFVLTEAQNKGHTQEVAI